MIDIQRAPTITFVADDAADQVFDLRQMWPRIAGLAARIDGAFPDARRIGVIFPSCPDLLLSWFAVLVAGREPIVPEFPTEKQSGERWRASIANTVDVGKIDALVCDEKLAATFPLPAPFLSPDPDADLAAVAGQSAEPPQYLDGAFLQLSSGTTGYRKAVRFTLQKVLQHVESYRPRVLAPEGGDTVVSWLPLSHDMGFVACFLMPLMTGVPVVMMDPIAWTRRPAILFEMIEKHAGTICYMPNFGFRRMMKETARPLPSMRHWVSCSEPVYLETMSAFGAHIGAPETTLEGCYAMAENVFAVTHSAGLQSAEIDGELRATCGFPIEGCEIKIVDDEIWVRSETSIVSYLDSPDITDGDGFYPTGDLGRMTDRGLVIIGRKGDLVNVAGRKYMLNDLDQILYEILPEARGRATTTKVFDEALETEAPLFLAETSDMAGDPERSHDIRRALADRSGIGSAQFAFVPPDFITKTSSGKANRKACATNYQLARDWQQAKAPARSFDLETAIRDYFGDALDWEQPAEDVLDSLGLVNLRLLAESADTRLDDGMSIAQLIASSKAPHASDDAKADGAYFNVVSLADSSMIKSFTPAYIEQLSATLGVPVRFEHICLPPSPILLRDLVFHDWFLPRAPGPAFDAVTEALGKIKAANVLIVDDVAELAFPSEQAFPVLNNRFKRSELANLLCFRWQKYSRLHHQLPLDVELGVDLPSDRNEQLDRLARYTGAMMFRTASLSRFADITEGWDFVNRVNQGHSTALAGTEEVRDAFGRWMMQNLDVLPRSLGEATPEARIVDLPHFCCWLIDRDRLVEVLDAHTRFCLVGAPSSVPFIAEYLAGQGKSFTYTNDLKVDQTFGADAFDCVLQIGSWGKPETSAPIFQIFFAGYATPGIYGEHFADPRVREARRASFAAIDAASRVGSLADS